MVTLVSIKLRGESNIIDDNPTMKQADEMSRQFIRDPNYFNVFYFLSVLISAPFCSRFLLYSKCIALVVVRVSLFSSLTMFRYKITILMVLLVIYANFISTQYLFYTARIRPGMAGQTSAQRWDFLPAVQWQCAALQSVIWTHGETRGKKVKVNITVM